MNRVQILHAREVQFLHALEVHFLLFAPPECKKVIFARMQNLLLRQWVNFACWQELTNEESVILET